MVNLVGISKLDYMFLVGSFSKKKCPTITRDFLSRLHYELFKLFGAPIFSKVPNNFRTKITGWKREKRFFVQKILPRHLPKIFELTIFSEYKSYQRVLLLNFQSSTNTVCTREKNVIVPNFLFQIPKLFKNKEPPPRWYLGPYGRRQLGFFKLITIFGFFVC